MKKSHCLLLPFLFLCSAQLFAQTSVTGRVTAQTDGTPLAGVTVTVKSTNLSTSTNNDGQYAINAPSNTTLVFSIVGYQTSERSVAPVVNIALTASDNSLSEVVVTGYTSQTRRAAPGSITRVRADEVRLQPVGSFDQQLQGKAAGVLVQSGSGQPGSAASVTIRGRTSVLGSTQPLYIVDGVQISAQDFQSLNPSDFDSYNILKDAVATAQYGSRGANGVIVITTKRGTANRTRLSYDYQYGVSQLPENKLKLMNSAEKIAFELSADGAYGTNPFGWTTQESDSLAKVNGNWSDAVFRKAATQQHQLSLSGGSERTRFFVSGSIFNQEGVVLATGLKRYSGRMNLDHTAGDFKVSLNAFVGSSTFSNTNETTVGVGSPLNAIRWHLPYVTPYLPDGSYNEADFGLQGQPNALEELLENKRLNRQLKAISALNITYQAPFLRGLSAGVNAGVDFTDNSIQRYVSPNTYLGSQQTGSQGAYATSNNRNRRYTVTSSLGYRRQADDHGFGLSLFNELVESRYTSFGYTGYGLTGAFKNAAGIIPGTPTNGFIPTVSGDESNNALLSYFAIADYNFRNRYFFNGTIRRDGASKLAQGKQWTTFGGIGASWVMTGEKFLKGLNFLSDLKLKVSYGEAANSNVGDDYEALEQFSSVSYNGSGGLLLTNIRKPDLTWETRKTFNAGIDFGFFRSRLSGTVELYNAVTDGLYLNRQISGTNGLTSLLTNMGRLRNRGIEASLTAQIVRGNGFNWTLSANHTINQSRILELDGEPDNIDGLFINRVGEAQNSLYLVRFAGVKEATGESIYLTKDGKETTTYDPADRVLVGKTDPPHFGGVTNSFSYKGLELSVQLTYMFGYQVYNNDRTNVENPGYYYSSFARSMLRAWTPTNKQTDIPGLLDDFHSETSRFVEDASFWRLRNVMMSYSLPASIARKINASVVRVFVQGQNLYTHHKVQGYDPEVPSGNLLGSQYPQLKTIAAGLSVGF